MANREELLRQARRKILLQKAREKLTGYVDDLGSTVQKQHPEISTQDRLILKNFAQSPQKQIEYLRQEYPGLQSEISQDGQLRAKNPQGQWMAVDPDNTGFDYSLDKEGGMEALKDVGDIGYDLYAAGSEGAAALGGAIVGGGATLPALGTGAIPGAMLAGGASTAANEAMRQKFGQYLGIPQEVSGEDVAVSGAIGAVAPMAFGAGKAKGLVPIAGEYVGKGMKKINPLPWVGEKISGIPRSNIRHFYDQNVDDAIGGMNKNTPYEYTSQTRDMLENYLNKNKDEATENLVNQIDSIGRPINMKPAKGSYELPQNRIINDDIVTNADQMTYDQLVNAQNKYYGLADETGDLIPDRISANKAWKIQKDLKREAKFGSDMTPADYEVKGAARDSYHKINKALDRASDGATQSAKDRFRNALVAEQEMLPKITGKTPADSVDKAFKKLSNLDRQSNLIYGARLNKLSQEGAEAAVEGAPEKKGLWEKVLSVGKKTEPSPKTNPVVEEVMDRANVLNTYKHFGESPGMTLFQTMKDGNKVPLSVGLGLAGGYSTGNADLTGNKAADYFLGAGAGVTAGQFLGSKAAMKAYIRAMRKAGRARELITPRDTGLYRAIKTGGGTELTDDLVKSRDDKQ